MCIQRNVAIIEAIKISAKFSYLFEIEASSRNIPLLHISSMVYLRSSYGHLYKNGKVVPFFYSRNKFEIMKIKRNNFILCSFPLKRTIIFLMILPSHQMHSLSNFTEIYSFCIISSC